LPLCDGDVSFDAVIHFELRKPCLTVTSIRLSRKGAPESFRLPRRRAALWGNYDHPVLNLTTLSSVWILASHWTGITC
jgi:hypothetical protein